MDRQAYEIDDAPIFALIDRCILHSNDPAERVRLVFTATATALESSTILSEQFVAISFLALNSPTTTLAVEHFAGAFRQILSAGDLADSADLDLLTDLTAGILVGLLNLWLTIDPFPLRQRAVAAADEVGEIIARRKGERS